MTDKSDNMIGDGEFVTEINGGVRLIQKYGGLRFGTDALLLAAFTRRSRTAVELGCGSGAVSLLCAAYGKMGRITAVEVQPEYADLAQRNAEYNGYSDVIKVAAADARSFAEPAEAVFMNPPYMRVNAGKRNLDDGKYIARHEVFGGIADFCASAARILTCGGAFYAVYRPDRLTDLFCAMRSVSIEPKRMITVYSDSLHAPCLILVEGRRGAGTSLFTPKPFIMRERGVMTDDMKYIMENGEFNDGYTAR